MEKQKDKIAFSDFEKIDIRVGTVIEVEPFPEAHKPALQLLIDFGALGQMKSSAQICDLYEAENLKGRQVLAVVNFPAKQIAQFMSACLVLGFQTEEGVVLAQADRRVPNGLGLS